MDRLPPSISTFEQAPPPPPVAVAAPGDVGTLREHVTRIATSYACVAVGCIVGAPLELGVAATLTFGIAFAVLRCIRDPGEWSPAVVTSARCLGAVSLGIALSSVAAASALDDLLMAGALTAAIALTLATTGWTSAFEPPRHTAFVAFATAFCWPVGAFEDLPIVQLVMIAGASAMTFTSFAVARLQTGATATATVWILIMYSGVLGLLEG